MSLTAFTFTDRCRPVIEMGIGDARISSTDKWDAARWDTGRWAGSNPTGWLDIGCYVRSIRVEYGRARSTDRFVPGVANLVVDNQSGWADPSVLQNPALLNVRPGRAVRIGIEHKTLGMVWLFRGYLDAMNPTYEPVDTDTVVFECVDVLGEVNRSRNLPLDPPAEPEFAHDRIRRILDRSLWPTNAQFIEHSYEVLVSHALGGQSADLLGQAADSVGGSIFGEQNGNVVFRRRDWQTYTVGTPPEATIGNVNMEDHPGIPPTVLEHGYLTPTVGTVTTPDPGPLPNECVFVFKVRGPTGPQEWNQIASQLDAGSYSWDLRRHIAGAIYLGLSPDGAAYAQRGVFVPSPTDADEYLAVALKASGNPSMSSWGSVDGTTWLRIADDANPAPFVLFDSTMPVRIGAYLTSNDPFNGRIYSVELRTGLDPAGGSVVWRFDADEAPINATTTTYTDPRGRTWTVTDPEAITPAVVDPGIPAVLADVCPVEWERPFRRADLATRAILGRDQMTAVQVDDVAGQAAYGIEPFEQTDLWTQDDQRLVYLAERVLRTRSALSAPRVRAVTLDARTADNALDLMTSVDPYKPSRYRCRLQYPRGMVFDAQQIATGVLHEMTPDSWTLALNLDSAAPYAVAGGRWDQAHWDRNTWQGLPVTAAGGL